jgi:Holliday junction resolvasome RuvABC endonuclease subunit
MRPLWIGVDPPNGWAVAEVDTRCIVAWGIEDNLCTLRDTLEPYLRSGNVGLIAYESANLKYGKSAAQCLRCEGVLLDLADRHGVKIVGVAPVAVKAHVVGRKSATKGQVLKATREILDIPQSFKVDHASDAAGVIAAVIKQREGKLKAI